MGCLRKLRGNKRIAGADVNLTYLETLPAQGCSRPPAADILNA